MKIIVAPDSFKESLTAREACEAIERGIRRVLPDAVIDLIPMADGGEGTVDAMVAATGGGFKESIVAGPLGEPVVARWGMLGSGQNTAVLEMAAASGLALVPSGRRDPTETTTFGTGELIRYALNSGAERILIGIGGSATTDGGTGAAQAIGVRFVGSQDAELPPHVSGGQLDRIDRINLSQRDSRIEEVEIEVACDVDNPLCGPRGAAQVYGAQKGATPRQVEQLDRNLAHLADLIQRDLGRDVREIEGAGAAGGLGAGLVAFFDAALRPGIQIVTDTLRLSERIAEADLVITGEGRIDEQSMMGKVIAGVGKAARAAGAPVIALVGSVGDGADSTLDVLDSYHAISPANLPFEQARMQAAERLEETTCTVLKERVG